MEADFSESGNRDEFEVPAFNFSRTIMTTAHYHKSSATNHTIRVILCALLSVISLNPSLTMYGKYFLLLVTPFFAVDEKEENGIP